MKKAENNIIICVIAGLFLSQLAGCTTRKQEESSVVQFAFWADRWNRPLATEMVKMFNQTAPEVKVSYLPVESPQKLLTMISGGTPPDIMVLQPYQMVDYATRGVLLELDRFIKDDIVFDELNEDIHPGLLKEGEYQHRLYAVPIWTNILTLFYNKDLFDEVGISYPDNTWTWENILEAGRRLTMDKDKNGSVDQFGFYGGEMHTYTIGEPYGWSLYLFIRGNGLNLFSADGRKCFIEEPDIKEIIQWALDLKSRYHIIPTGTDMSTGRFGPGSGQSFAEGRMGMDIGGRWFLNVFLANAKFDWGVAPYPKGKMRVMTRGTILLGVSNKTKYPEACWRFMRYMMNENGQGYIIKERSDTSILISLGKTDVFLNYYSRPDANRLFVEGLAYTEKYPIFPGQEELWDLSRMLFEQVEQKEISLDDACRQITKKHEELVRQEKR